MPYEDPIEAALRALTDIEWRKRKDVFEARINHTHLVGIQEMLVEHNIAVTAEVSAARSGRYIATIQATELPNILKAVKATKASIKAPRRKQNT